LKSIFTIPDLELNQESSVDPLGMQVIWTKYGQDVFGEKINTIANDLRVLTFNLFHCQVLRKLFDNYSNEINEAKTKFKKYESDFDVKAGLLILMEDIVTHIFYQNKQADAELLGVLGMTKARALYQSKSEDEIIVSAEKSKGILVRQINLGMMGRYKGSMMSMAFFDRSFSFNPNTWEDVDAKDLLVEFKELEQILTAFICNVILKIRNTEEPSISVSEIQKSSYWDALSTLYLKCFSTRKLSTILQDYWKDRLGFNSGAAAAIFNVVSEIQPNQEIIHKNIFELAALRLATEPTEEQKIQTILKVEPILSHLSFIFRYLAQPSISFLNEECIKVIGEIRQLIRKEINLSEVDIHPRLQRLVNLLHEEIDEKAFLVKLLNYHKDIMISRGGTAWLGIVAEQNIRHYFSPSLPDSTNTLEKYLAKKPWRHTYYVETLLSMKQCLN
jgi:hypothetical protein